MKRILSTLLSLFVVFATTCGSIGIAYAQNDETQVLESNEEISPTEVPAEESTATESDNSAQPIDETINSASQERDGSMLPEISLGIDSPKEIGESGGAISTLATLESEDTVITYDEGNIFPADGIWYKVLTDEEGNRTVEVTNDDNLNQSFGQESLIIPDSVTHPETSIEYNVVQIAELAFAECKSFTSLTLPKKNELDIGIKAFLNTNITGTLTIPSNVTRIGEYGFDHCQGITALNLPEEGDLRLEGRAFGFCDGITGTLIVPSSVTYLGYAVFHDCYGITKVIMPSCTEIEFGGTLFIQCYGIKEIWWKEIPNNLGWEPCYKLSDNSISFFENTEDILGTDISVWWENRAECGYIPEPLTVTRGAGDDLSEAMAIKTKNIASPVFYWKKDGAIIPGQTSDTLMLQELTKADEGIYTLYLLDEEREPWPPVDPTNLQFLDELDEYEIAQVDLIVEEYPPGITGPTAMTVTEGYEAFSTDAYTKTGKPDPTVLLNNDIFSWDEEADRLRISAGLSQGTYTVLLTASNGIEPDSTVEFTLTVLERPVDPVTPDAPINPASAATSAAASTAPNTGDGNTASLFSVLGLSALLGGASLITGYALRRARVNR